MEAPQFELDETLDPQDWEKMRALGRRMVDDMMDYLQNIREQPVWQPVPAEIKAYLQQPLPVDPSDAESVYQEFLQNILPYRMGNIHPRFWSWVIGTGTPFGVLAEMLAAAMNPNVGGGDHGAVYVESQVIEWCKEIFSFPPEASGLLLSGGSMANFTGLTVARNTCAGYNIRAEGFHAAAQPLAIYGSVEMHSSIDKSAEALGFGQAGLHKIPVDPEFRMDIPALERALEEDKKAGIRPVCIIGNAGTVNTGAFDDLDRLADICAREGIWFHVDGAFGSLAILTEHFKHLVNGIQRADSLAFDLHKWLYMPYGVGCTLVRRGSDHINAFSLTPAYLAHANRGLGGSNLWFSDYGIELSRGFLALKAWMSIKEHGIQKYGQMIEKNIQQAHYLADLVDGHPNLERIAPAPLNIVCFRYNPGSLDTESLNRFNQELLYRLQESGSAAPSYTTLLDQYGIRVAITNHRTQFSDLDLLVEKVVEIGRELSK